MIFSKQWIRFQSFKQKEKIKLNKLNVNIQNAKQYSGVSLNFRIRWESPDLDVDFPRQLADFSGVQLVEVLYLSNAAKCAKRQIFDNGNSKVALLKEWAALMGVGGVGALKMMDFFVDIFIFNSFWIFVYSNDNYSFSHPSKESPRNQIVETKSRDVKGTNSLRGLQLFRNLCNYIKVNPGACGSVSWWSWVVHLNAQIRKQFGEFLGGKFPKKTSWFAETLGVRRQLNAVSRKKTQHDLCSDLFHQQLRQTFLEWSLTYRGDIDLEPLF